ncbi:MAG: DNA primase [Chloroflexota bacterium]
MSTVSEIKQKVDIVDLISESVPLQKAGRNYKGLCPFHSEKHASFFVFPDQQRWHCFGACGTGGDIFSFVMKKEGVGFGEALQLLAERSGTQLPPRQAGQTVQDRERQRLLDIHEAAAQYYQHILTTARAAEAARGYLERRNISTDTAETFRLGFAPDSWDALRRFLGDKGYTEAELLQAGLLVQSDRGHVYDRFRNRLVFTICDTSGHAIGFGARALDDSTPKYINSPQTLLFDKSSVVYGAHLARSATRQAGQVVIVEGYFDVLRAHQHGYHNVVASMGTSLTARQVDLLKRFTRNISLALDADAAGQAATLRSVETLTRELGEGVTPVPTWSGLVRYENTLDAEIKVIPLPRDKDPDDLIQGDPDLWQQLVDQATPILDFSFQAVLSEADLSSVRGKRWALETLAPLVQDIHEPLRRSHYVHKLAHALSINEHDVTASMRRIEKSRGASPTRPATERHETGGAGGSPLEEYCLALLLQYPELRASTEELSIEHFDSSEYREIFTQWLRADTIADLKQTLDGTLDEYLDFLLSKSFPPGIQDKEELRQLTLSDCVLRLQERLCKRAHVGAETLFNLARQEQGLEGEIAALEQQGIGTSQQLHRIFLKRQQRSKPKRGNDD